ncbi:MAG: HAD family hydrolase [Candidatus Bipolaricaulota bacterium]|nr:MAG: HAD family hydrolase [Candidatus Bipolaricaulota bacterium]
MTGLPTLLVFDLDGTLYRTEISFLPAVRRLFTARALPVPDPEEVLPFIGEPFSAFLRWAQGRGIARPLGELADEISRTESPLIADRAATYPGVPETLATLRARGHRLAVCTNGDRDYADLVLRSCGILDLFDLIRGRGPEDLSKARMVADVLAAIPHDAAYVVGDRKHDIESARENGCPSIGALYGYGERGELDGADYAITSFSELLSIVH